ACFVAEPLVRGEIDRVVERRVWSDLQVVDRRSQTFWILCEVLHQGYGTIETDRERQVFGSQDRFKESVRSVFLFVEDRPHAEAGVDQHGERQRQFVFVREVENVLSSAVFLDGEVRRG